MYVNVTIQEIANGFLVNPDTSMLGGGEPSLTYYPTEEALRADALAIIDRAIEAGRKVRAELEQQRTQQLNYASNQRNAMDLGQYRAAGSIVGAMSARQ